MENDLVYQKSWLQRNWKWALPLLIVVILASKLFFSLTAGHLNDFGKAYADPQLYEGAVEIAQQNKEIEELLGEIEPVSKMAILEGDVKYTNQNNNAHFTVRIEGNKGKANMEGIAVRENGTWEYKKLTVRIKNPPENKQTIFVIK